jgi:hypothetical protein
LILRISIGPFTVMNSSSALGKRASRCRHHTVLDVVPADRIPYGFEQQVAAVEPYAIDLLDLGSAKTREAATSFADV